MPGRRFDPDKRRFRPLPDQGQIEIYQRIAVLNVREDRAHSIHELGFRRWSRAVDANPGRYLVVEVDSEGPIFDGAVNLDYDGRGRIRRVE